ncbi:MAG: hypothetical protein KGO49_00020 [Gammaproteobacteria bacterium]|nr:hypothetical protein [Gammaproteobacteria bacterium]
MQSTHDSTTQTIDNKTLVQMRRDIQLGKIALLIGIITFSLIAFIMLAGLKEYMDLCYGLYIVGIISGLDGLSKIRQNVELSTAFIFMFWIVLLFFPLNMIYYCIFFSKASATLSCVEDMIEEEQRNLT